MSQRTLTSTARSSCCDGAALDVSVRSEDRSAWMIEVRGELDLLTGQILEQRLKSHACSTGDGGHPGRIVYRLPQVEFIDVSGLDSLLAAADQHTAGSTTIRDPSPRVRRLLELVDLDSMIEEQTDDAQGT
jgi:anti-anti-sigma factor